MIAALVTTYNRPHALARTLPQIAALNVPILVVDDGSEISKENEIICNENAARYLYMPANRGLAAAMNIGLSYLLADKRIRRISYFQDDVDVHPRILEILQRLEPLAPLLTGHDAGEHGDFWRGRIEGQWCKFKRSCRATHLHAASDFWRAIYPIPTYELGAPKPNGNGTKGIGSNVDWWIVRDAPKSIQRLNQKIICVPGLVRSFFWESKDSCWNNTSPAGEEPQLTTQ